MGREVNTSAANKAEIILIGSIHESHNNNPNYSQAQLKQLLVALAPSAILVELPATIEIGGEVKKTVDGEGRISPWLLEHPASPLRAGDEAAQELGVKQIPIDRPRRNEHYREVGLFERQKRSMELARRWELEVRDKQPDCPHLLISSLQDRAGRSQDILSSSGGPEVINSIGFDEIVRIKHSVWYRIMPSILAEYPGYESVAEDWAFLGREWDERNSIMADNIMKASGEYPGRRLVAVVGCEHRYILRDLLLERDGVLLKEFWEILALSKGEFEVSYMEIVRLVREIKRIQVQSKSTEDAWEKAQGHVRRLEDLGVRIDRDWFRHIRHML